MILLSGSLIIIIIIIIIICSLPKRGYRVHKPKPEHDTRNNSYYIIIIIIIIARTEKFVFLRHISCCY